MSNTPDEQPKLLNDLTEAEYDVLVKERYAKPDEQPKPAMNQPCPHGLSNAGFCTKCYPIKQHNYSRECPMGEHEFIETADEVYCKYCAKPPAKPSDEQPKQIVPLGTDTPYGKVEAVHNSGGERRYMMIKDGVVSDMPADVIEAPDEEAEATGHQEYDQTDPDGTWPCFCERDHDHPLQERWPKAAWPATRGIIEPKKVRSADGSLPPQPIETDSVEAILQRVEIIESTVLDFMKLMRETAEANTAAINQLSQAVEAHTHAFEALGVAEIEALKAINKEGDK